MGMLDPGFPDPPKKALSDVKPLSVLVVGAGEHAAVGSVCRLGAGNVSLLDNWLFYCTVTYPRSPLIREIPSVTFWRAFRLRCLCTVGEEREFGIILFSLCLADSEAGS